MVSPASGGDERVDTETMVPGDGESDFISDVSQQNGSRGFEVDSANGAAGSGSATPQATAAPTDSGSGDGAAQRAISEADILQLDGDRLYALSRYSGLSIVDVSNPAALKLEGVYRSAAEPFEMYVQDGMVFAMFNGWYSYHCDERQVCGWQQTSRMQAIDARDPANIELLADYEVPGGIDDSRRVGDVLYLATHEWGGCWGCGTQPSTAITSFNVADPSKFVQVDQLRLPAASDSYLGQRSITVTDQRIYISGWEWNYGLSSSSQNASSIQVVDISDPQGKLKQGAKFAIAGQVQSRWQMDEYDSVLRVISQPNGWGSGTPPVVETFRVNGADDVQRAGSLTIQLPQANEVLQSVRFDGARAFAITSEQRDPLFTFDLSDPAHPVQRGQLEMPGWVYHMEPRGDRMYALGYDQQNPAGSLNVSLFDVSDLDQPQLIQRVNFGGDWGSFAEDQNRIQKAFSILDDAGLILVPFSGGSYGKDQCSYEWGSGIQLIDFTPDTLAKRGVAPQVGNARRALLHRDQLFGIGDNTVQTFDISNRDQPIASARLDVARNVSTVRVVGDQLMRFGNDWFTQQTILDMTPLAQAGDAQPHAEIDLSAVFGGDTYSCGGSAYWGGQVFTRGGYAYVPRYSYTYSNNYGGRYEQTITLYIVDMTAPGGPKAIGSFAVDPAGQNSWFAGIVQTENSLLIGRSTGYWSYSDGQITSKPSFSYDVIDLREPAAPRLATRFEVPSLIAGGGWGYFPMAGGCSIDLGWGWYGGGYYGRYYGDSLALTDGDLVVSQHLEPLDDGSDRARYFLDRIDVSNPDQPRVLPKINIPGTPIHFNAETGELITLDYNNSVEPGQDWNDCGARGAYGYFDETLRACRVTRRTLNALVIRGDRAVRTSRLSLDQTRRLANIAVSDSRVFFTTTDFPYREDPTAGMRSNDVPPLMPVTLETLRLDSGQLVRLPSRDLREMPSSGWYSGQLFARDQRVFEIYDNRVTVVDTADGRKPATLTHEIPGYGCGSLEVAADSAYCALGQRGVEVIDMSSMR
ncbi:MAG TPA: beta-propeller domain-containing protein [Polyangiaceae bacterium]|nr:beta-propeller domain-containing protein [Polyangiaceae bacterium]